MADNTTLTIQAVDIGMSCFAYICMLFVSSGNTMTILAISRTESLRTLANVYVISLAVADLMVGLGFGLLGIFMLPPLKKKYFDENIHMCVFTQGITIGTIMTSSFHMTLIAFDRFIYITRPYIYHRLFSKRNVGVILTAIWGFGIFMMFIPQYSHNDITQLPDSDCDLTKSLKMWYFLYANGIIVGFNLIAAIVFYYQILIVALRQRKTIKATSKHVTVVSKNSTDKNIDTGDGIPTNNENQQQRDDTAYSNTSRVAMKSIKFFFTVFGFYFICVIPVIVCTTLDRIATIHEVPFRIATLVLMLNSGMNFIIYAVLNKQYRQAFIDMIKCDCRSV